MVTPTAPWPLSLAQMARTVSSPATSGRDKDRSPNSLTSAVHRRFLAGTHQTVELVGSWHTRARVSISWRSTTQQMASIFLQQLWMLWRTTRLLSLEGLMLLPFRFLSPTAVWRSKPWRGVRWYAMGPFEVFEGQASSRTVPINTIKQPQMYAMGGWLKVHVGNDGVRYGCEFWYLARQFKLILMHLTSTNHWIFRTS